MRLIRAVTYLAVFLLAAAGARADQVILKNGDRATGKIVKKDDKAVTVNSDHFGTVTIAWDQVERISTDEPVTVVLPGGTAVSGSLSTDADQVQIKTDSGQRTARLSELVAVRNAAEQRAYERLLNPGWLDLWNGGATFGLAGTQGNAETRTLTVAFTGARVSNADKVAVYFNAISASALLNGVDAATARAVRGGWGYARNLRPRLFVNTFNDYEYDRFQNLDLRVVFGGGLGYIVWQREKNRLDVNGGLAWNHERFSPLAPAAAFTRNSAEAYIGDEFVYALNASTSMYQRARFFPNLSNGGEYRFNFDLGANTRLTRWLNWNIGISNRYLSNPVAGRQTNDFLYTTGIGVTYSR